MKTNKEYDKINAELVRVLNERDAARNALIWCLREMPEPRKSPPKESVYSDGYWKARDVIGHPI